MDINKIDVEHLLRPLILEGYCGDYSGIFADYEKTPEFKMRYDLEKSLYKEAEFYLEQLELFEKSNPEYTI